LYIGLFKNFKNYNIYSMNINHLYIHVPFCKSKCSYCAFYSIVDSSLQNKWCSAIINQFNYFSTLYEITKLKTLYIGGGSPSALDPEILISILCYFNDFCASDTEFTIELNPADLSDELVHLLKDSSINRVSIGIESFNDTVRNAVKRRGTSSEILKAIKMLKHQTSFAIACDLMYGLPLQTKDIVQDDIKKLIEFHPDHISYYELTVEDISALARELNHKTVSLPAYDVNESSWEIILTSLFDAGYERYEVSNWAYQKNYCYHNINYWEMGSWLGLGPSAVSNIDGFGSYTRITTVSNIYAYLSNILDLSTDYIAGKTAVIEYCMMHLRKKNGFSTRDFYQRFSTQFHHIPEWLCNQFPLYLMNENNRITVHDTGLDHLNYIIVQLMNYLE